MRRTVRRRQRKRDGSNWNPKVEPLSLDIKSALVSWLAALHSIFVTSVPLGLRSSRYASSLILHPLRGPLRGEDESVERA